MGSIERDKCDFCKEVKSVERTYLRPTNPPKEKTSEMYNEGDYFIIVKTCSDCGLPKTKDKQPTKTKVRWEK